MPLRFKDKLEGTITNADYASSAGTASKIGTNAGGSTTPVYFANGVPVALGYTIQSSVPANAKFTDTNTTYNVFNGATASAAGSTGLVPAPTAGQQGYFLRGDRTWAALSKSTVGLGNVDNTADANKSVKAATTATNDVKNQAITGYIRGLSVSGRTITYTKGDGTTGTITTQDTNTTYGVFGKATADAAGSNGLVPAPAKGQQGLYLRGDGTWATPANTTYGNFKGSTSSAAGGSGLVPAPGSNVLNQYLKSTGAWGQVAWGEISGKPSTFTPASHTHSYAGSASAGGSANSAVKLDTATAGSSTQPVYFSGGKPVAIGYTIQSNVPSGAKFTDTNTWRGIQDNLTSTSTTDSLSANQGKVLKGLVDGKAASNHTHTSVNDIGDGGATTFAYSKAGLNYGDFAWVAAWNGKELRAVNKSVFAQASHSHSYLPLSGGTVTGVTAFSNTTASTSKSTGAVKVSGGVGVAGRMSANEIMIGDGCTLTYDATNKCVNFVFS